MVSRRVRSFVARVAADATTSRRMHQISDGERRRVQLCMGLMGNWDVLLLDEVTVDLDALVRAELLAFLVKESKERGATIVYATHIYDHIETFPTHICHLRLGRTPDEMVTYSPSSTIMEDSVAAEEKRGELLGIALRWLREDREVRKVRDKERGRERGAKSGGDVSRGRGRDPRDGALMSIYPSRMVDRRGTPRRFTKSTITTPERPRYR